jgi:hypothetical protein
MTIIAKRPYFYMIKKVLILMSFPTLFFSCTSYEQFHFITEEFEIPSKVFRSDFTQTWQAVLQIMRKYDLEITNQEAGVIKTRWIDNTLELNFADSFGSSDSVKAARFKVVVNVVKGFRANREVSKVTVYKRQMIEQDFLQGWKVVRTDGILEDSILYRIEKLLSIDERLKKIEDQKAKEAEMSF